MTAETERQRLTREYEGVNFVLFLKVEAEDEVQQQAVVRMYNDTIKKLDKDWEETNTELLHLNEAISAAQDPKDEKTLSILRRRCLNLHHERISINIQRNKLLKEQQHGQTA